MNSKKNLTIIVLAIIVIGVLAFQFLNHTGPFKDDSQHSSSNSTQIELKGKEKVHVNRVVDGDTFVAKKSNGEQIKVRLNNKDVYLEYDKEKEDRYGRTLAYVWLDEKTMYNEELVKKGLAREKYFSPNGKYRSTFEKDEQQAKKDKVNLWS